MTNIDDNLSYKVEATMEEYRKMYLHLFNAVTDALGLLEEEKTKAAALVLQRAQQRCERMYIEREEAFVKAPHVEQQ